MNRAELLNTVSKLNPPYKYMDVEPFNTYGIWIDGVYAKWDWFTDDNISTVLLQQGKKSLTTASNEELLEMWALSETYWREMYEGIVRKVEKSGIEWYSL